MALINQAELEARLGRELTTEEQQAFPVVRDAAERYVEDMLGSSLTSTTETQRFYDGGYQHTRIDPCTNVTAVALVDDDQTLYETIDTTDYTLEPINKTLKTMIRYRNGRLPVGINNIRVSAKFSLVGDTSTLNLAKNAILDLIITEIQNAGNIKRESIEGYSVEYQDIKETASMKALQAIVPPMI